MTRRDHRAPGIYTERTRRRRNPIGLEDTGVPAFLGLATRGPVDTPAVVSSFDDFYKIFGPRVENSYLPDAVYGFFANGGKSCYVIRIAHRRGGEGELAKGSAITVNDAQERATLRIEAASEGEWGNNLEVEVRNPQAKVQTYLTFDLEEGGTKAVVKSARGFERGSLVKIHSEKGTHFAVLSDVQSKVLRLREQDGAPMAFKSSDLTYVEPVEFDLFVRERGKRELHTGLSLAEGSERYPERYIAEHSELIRVKVLENPGPLHERVPVETGPLKLRGGSDGVTAVTPQDFIGMNEGPGYRVGLAALEANEEIDLVVLPDLMTCLEHSEGFRGLRDVETVQEAVLQHCERMGDRLAVLDVPRGFDIEKAISWRLQFDSAFGAFYYPWIAVSATDGKLLMPPSGHIVGVYARCDRESGPHRAAANELIQGAIHLEVSLDEEELGYLNAQQLNPIRVMPARGIRVWGARTASSRQEWRFVPVRRVFNAIRRAVIQGTQWVVFENNDPTLWRALERQLKTFLQDLFDKGYFAGEKPDEAFFVKCDEETNPVERIAAGELVAEIGLAPVRPAEFITFTLEQQLPEQG